MAVLKKLTTKFWKNPGFSKEIQPHLNPLPSRMSLGRMPQVGFKTGTALSLSSIAARNQRLTHAQRLADVSARKEETSAPLSGISIGPRGGPAGPITKLPAPTPLNQPRAPAFISGGPQGAATLRKHLKLGPLTQPALNLRTFTMIVKGEENPWTEHPDTPTLVDAINSSAGLGWKGGPPGWLGRRSDFVNGLFMSVPALVSAGRNLWSHAVTLSYLARSVVNWAVWGELGKLGVNVGLPVDPETGRVLHYRLTYHPFDYSKDAGKLELIGEWEEWAKDGRPFEWMSPQQQARLEAQKKAEEHLVRVSDLTDVWRAMTTPDPVWGFKTWAEYEAQPGYRAKRGKTAEEQRRYSEERKAYLAQQVSAKRDAVILRNRAFSALGEAQNIGEMIQAGTATAAQTDRAIQSVDLARESLRQAIDAEIRGATIGDPYYFYTGRIHKENREEFLNAIVDIEMQASRTLTPWEIEDIKQRFVDPWDEVPGEIVFDYQWLIPALDKVFALPFKAVGKTAKAIGAGIDVVTAKLMGVKLVEFLGAKAESSLIRHLGHTSEDVIERLAFASTKTVEGAEGETTLKELLGKLGQVASTPTGVITREADEAAQILLGVGTIGPREIEGARRMAQAIPVSDWPKLVDRVSKDVYDEWNQVFYEKLSRDPNLRRRILADLTRAGKIGADMTRNQIDDLVAVDVKVLAERMAREAAEKPRNLIGALGDAFRRADAETRFQRTGFKFDVSIPEMILKHYNIFEKFPRFRIAFDSSMELWQKVFGWWATATLTMRPAWNVINLLDTQMRYLMTSPMSIGNLADLVRTYLPGNNLLIERALRETGYLPRELTEQFAQTGVPLGSSIIERILADADYRPSLTGAPMTFLRDEWKRLRPSELIHESFATRARRAGSNFLDSVRRTGFLPVVLERTGTAVNRSAGDALRLWSRVGRDYANLLEISFRLNMFHQVFTRNFVGLDTVAKAGMIRSLRDAGAAPETIDLFSQAWHAARYNPDELGEILTEIAEGKSKGRGYQVSQIVPPHLETMAIDPASRDLLATEIRDRLSEFRRTILERGETLTPQSYQRFFDDLTTKVREATVARARAMNQGLRSVSMNGLPGDRQITGFRIGISPVNGAEPVLYDGYLLRAQALVADGDLEGAARLRRRAVGHGTDYMRNVFPDLPDLEIQATEGVFDVAEREPSIRFSASVNMSQVDEITYRTAVVARDEFKQRQVILHWVDDAPDLPFGISDAARGESIEPSMTLRFDHALTLAEEENLYQTAIRGGKVVGFELHPDRMGVDFINLSIYNTDYGGYLDDLTRIARDLESQAIPCRAQVQTRRVRTLGYTRSVAGAGDGGLVSYEDVIRHYESTPEGAAYLAQQEQYHPRVIYGEPSIERPARATNLDVPESVLDPSELAERRRFLEDSAWMGHEDVRQAYEYRVQQIAANAESLANKKEIVDQYAATVRQASRLRRNAMSWVIEGIPEGPRGGAYIAGPTGEIARRGNYRAWEELVFPFEKKVDYVDARLSQEISDALIRGEKFVLTDEEYLKRFGIELTYNTRGANAGELRRIVLEHPVTHQRMVYETGQDMRNFMALFYGEAIPPHLRPQAAFQEPWMNRLAAWAVSPAGTTPDDLVRGAKAEGIFGMKLGNGVKDNRLYQEVALIGRDGEGRLRLLVREPATGKQSIMLYDDLVHVSPTVRGIDDFRTSRAAVGRLDADAEHWLTITDAYAERWAQRYGHPKSEFYEMWIAGITGTPPTSGRVLYQIGQSVEDTKRAFISAMDDTRAALRRTHSIADTDRIIQDVLNEVVVERATAEESRALDLLHTAKKAMDAARDAQRTVLRQINEGIAKGAVSMVDQGKFLIHLTDPDASTLGHEMAHVFHQSLIQEATVNPLAKRDLEIFERWIGVKQGAWTDAAREKFARGFEAFMREGIAPTPELLGAFRRIRTFLHDVYLTVIRGGPLDVGLTDEVRRAYGRFFADIPEDAEALLTRQDRIAARLYEQGIELHPTVPALKVVPEPMEGALKFEGRYYTALTPQDIEVVHAVEAEINYQETVTSANRRLWDTLSTPSVKIEDPRMRRAVLDEIESMRQEVMAMTDGSEPEWFRALPNSRSKREDVLNALVLIEQGELPVGMRRPPARVVSRVRGALSDSIFSGTQVGPLPFRSPSPEIMRMSGFPEDLVSQADEQFYSRHGIHQAELLDVIVEREVREQQAQGWAAFVRNPAFYRGRSILDEWGEIANDRATFMASIEDTIRMLRDGPWGERNASPLIEAMQALKRDAEDFMGLVNADLSRRVPKNIRDAVAELRVLHPTFVPEGDLPEGLLQWLRSGQAIQARGQQAESMLTLWRDWIMGQAEKGDVFAKGLPIDQADILKNNLPAIVQAKYGVMDAAVYGSAEKGIKGALPETNHSMLDYSDYNNFDAIMRKIIPFWMFPSRSIPFWMEQTLAHPSTFALYYKYIQNSQRAAYRYGFIDSEGKPLSSLEGAYPLGDTGIWFNPLSPWSGRYIFPRAGRRYDDVDEELGVVAKVYSYLQEYGQYWGVSIGPWVSIALQMGGAAGVANQYSAFPLISELELIPKWWRDSLLEKMNLLDNPVVHSNVSPEVPWRDYLIERYMLTDVLDKLQNGDLTDAEKVALVHQAESAIGTTQRETVPLWQTYKRDFELGEYYIKTVGFFTGYYGRRYTDADAEMLRLRSELNSLRDNINRIVGAVVLGLEPDPEALYENYTKLRYGTPEGLVYNLYNSIRFVRMPESLKPARGLERRDLLATQIESDLQTRARYDYLALLQYVRDQKLHELPIGSDSPLKQKIWQDYMSQRVGADTMFPMARTEWMIGYKPTTSILAHYRDNWLRVIWETRPVWNKDQGEKYGDYQARFQQWIVELPMLADSLRPNFENNMTIALREGTAFRELGEAPMIDVPTFIAQLMKETTIETLDKWRDETATLYTALDRVYSRYYYDTYWDAIEGKSGKALELAKQLWKQGHPEPTTQQMVAWMAQDFAGRWTPEAIAAAAEGRGVDTVDERLAPKTGAERELEAIYTIYGWAAPGTQRGDMMEENRKLGGDDGDFDILLGAGGNWSDPDDRAAFLARMEKIALILKLGTPSLGQLRLQVQAESLNKEFRAQVEGRLGPDFWAEYTYYLSLSSYEKRGFKAKHPRIQKYYDMRTAWAKLNPVWAGFYIAKSTSGYSSGGGGRGGRRGAGGGAQASAAPFLPMGRRSTMNAMELVATPAKVGSKKPLANLPPELIQSIPQEILTHITEEVPLTAYELEYLSQLAQLHPEWRDALQPLTRL